MLTKSADVLGGDAEEDAAFMADGVTGSRDQATDMIFDGKTGVAAFGKDASRFFIFECASKIFLVVEEIHIPASIRAEEFGAEPQLLHETLTVRFKIFFHAVLAREAQERHGFCTGDEGRQENRELTRRIFSETYARDCPNALHASADSPSGVR